MESRRLSTGINNKLNIYKAIYSLKSYLAKSGYEQMIIEYLQNGTHAEEFN